MLDRFGTLYQVQAVKKRFDAIDDAPATETKNLHHHGLSPELARGAQIVRSVVLIRHGEERFASLTRIEGRRFICVWTEREQSQWRISPFPARDKSLRQKGLLD